jgi:hypothetical protein
MVNSPQVFLDAKKRRKTAVAQVISPFGFSPFGPFGGFGSPFGFGVSVPVPSGALSPRDGLSGG